MNYQRLNAAHAVMVTFPEPIVPNPKTFSFFFPNAIAILMTPEKDKWTGLVAWDREILNYLLNLAENASAEERAACQAEVRTFMQFCKDWLIDQPEVKV